MLAHGGSILFAWLLLPSFSFHTNYGRQNNGPLKIPGTNFQTYEYITLHGKWNFVYMIKLRVLRWEDDPVLSEWAHCICKNLYKREKPGISE